MRFLCCGDKKGAGSSLPRPQIQTDPNPQQNPNGFNLVLKCSICLKSFMKFWLLVFVILLLINAENEEEEPTSRVVLKDPSGADLLCNLPMNAVQGTFGAKSKKPTAFMDVKTNKQKIFASRNNKD